MAWLAVNKDGEEFIFNTKPERDYIYKKYWKSYEKPVILPKGTINRIINRIITWNDEPVEI